MSGRDQLPIIKPAVRRKASKRRAPVAERPVVDVDAEAQSGSPGVPLRKKKRAPAETQGHAPAATSAGQVEAIVAVEEHVGTSSGERNVDLVKAATFLPRQAVPACNMLAQCLSVAVYDQFNLRAAPSKLSRLQELIAELCGLFPSFYEESYPTMLDSDRYKHQVSSLTADLSVWKGKGKAQMTEQKLFERNQDVQRLEKKLTAQDGQIMVLKGDVIRFRADADCWKTKCQAALKEKDAADAKAAELEDTLGNQVQKVVRFFFDSDPKRDFSFLPEVYQDVIAVWREDLEEEEEEAARAEDAASNAGGDWDEQPASVGVAVPQGGDDQPQDVPADGDQPLAA